MNDKSKKRSNREYLLPKVRESSKETWNKAWDTAKRKEETKEKWLKTKMDKKGGEH